jgi:hypothetical protein
VVNTRLPISPGIKQRAISDLAPRPELQGAVTVA